MHWLVVLLGDAGVDAARCRASTSTWWELYVSEGAPALADARSADGSGVVYFVGALLYDLDHHHGGVWRLRVANEHEACFMALILVISIVLQTLVASMSTLILSSDSTRNLPQA